MGLPTYVFYSLSIILVYVSLATLLQMQFGQLGIVNFGIVGFWGLGLYGFGVLLLQYGVPYLPALILATALATLVAFVLGWIILDLDSQSVLVATLAFATVVADLATTEKWLTEGIRGLGSIPYPLDLGADSEFGLFLLILVATCAVLFYAVRLRRAPYGRLLAGIRDNEVLARGIGKPTVRHKLIFFTVTSGAMGFFGALSASIQHFLVPTLVAPTVTFSVWIALIVGGRQSPLGGLIGVLATIAVFDFLIELFVPIPAGYAQYLPIVKLMLYGLTLMVVLLYRPLGILGARK